MGPFPPEYDGGIQEAIGVLHSSNRPGKNKAKMKFSSERKARSVHFDMFMESSLVSATD